MRRRSFEQGRNWVFALYTLAILIIAFAVVVMVQYVPSAPPWELALGLDEGSGLCVGALSVAVGIFVFQWAMDHAGTLDLKNTAQRNHDRTMLEFERSKEHFNELWTAMRDPRFVCRSSPPPGDGSHGGAQDRQAQ